jgi:hypothetical protein
MMSTTAAVSTLSIATLSVPEERVTQGTLHIQPLEPLSRDLVPNTLSAQPLVKPDDEQLKQSETHALVASPSGLVSIGASEGEGKPSLLKSNAVAIKGVAVTKQMLQKSAMNSVYPPTNRKRCTYPWPVTAEVEASLCDKIHDLWTIHIEKDGALRGGRRELRELRAKLGQHLSEYKKLLVGTGRGGKWSEFLRVAKIPKATADRYVNKWELAHSPKTGNLLSEDIHEPSTDTIVALVKKLKPQLLRKLTTPDSISLFLAELAVALESSPNAS